MEGMAMWSELRCLATASTEPLSGGRVPVDLKPRPQSLGFAWPVWD